MGRGSNIVSANVSIETSCELGSSQNLLPGGSSIAASSSQLPRWQLYGGTDMKKTLRGGNTCLYLDATPTQQREGTLFS